MIRQLLAKFRRHKKEEPRKETCDYCKHLYYNSDGSVSCDSSFEKSLSDKWCKNVQRTDVKQTLTSIPTRLSALGV